MIPVQGESYQTRQSKQKLNHLTNNTQFILRQIILILIDPTLKTGWYTCFYYYNG